MNGSDEHYRELVRKREKTRLATCGYIDRFDPFVLNDVERVYNLYDGLFRTYLTGIPCTRLLDVGCGTGIYFRALAGYADNIEAIDTSQEMLGVAREYCEKTGLAGFHLGQAAAESLPYDDESFDVVVALDLLHHVSDAGRTLEEIDRVLKRGGHLFVFEPNILNPLMFLAHAIPAAERRALRRNTPGRLITLLEGRFQSVRWDGICELVTESTGAKGFLLDAYLKVWRISGFERLFPRQAWLGQKR